MGLRSSLLIASTLFISHSVLEVAERTGIYIRSTYPQKSRANGLCDSISVSGHGATVAALNASTATTGPLPVILNSVQNPLNGSPKATISWILFDEQFKPVADSSSFDLINTTSDAVKSHQRTVNISKGGHLYVYCSSESNVDVFFDNLQLIHTRGPLLEETHYYPFGLTMAGISTKSAGKLDNKFEDNGKEKQRRNLAMGPG